MEITSSGALSLLETMLSECREDFEGGVVAYLDAEERERSARKALRLALQKFVRARNAKYLALSRFAPEYGFLMGNEPIKPMIEGELVVNRLIMNIIEGLDDTRYAKIADLWLKRPGDNEAEQGD